MSSDWQYIEDHMGGHDEDGLPNFMKESGFSDDSYYEEDYNDMEADYNSEVEFEIGDTVRLKSGGPLMTIRNVEDEVVICRWFTKKHKLKSAQFYKSEIEFDSEEDYEHETFYSCEQCYWSGTEDELDEDEYCPECGSFVTDDN